MRNGRGALRGPSPISVVGAIIEESIFGWPGVGSLSISSIATIATIDHPVVMAMVTVIATPVAVASAITDFFSGVLDPRVRYE